MPKDEAMAYVATGFRPIKHVCHLSGRTVADALYRSTLHRARLNA